MEPETRKKQSLTPEDLMKEADSIAETGEFSSLDRRYYRLFGLAIRSFNLLTQSLEDSTRQSQRLEKVNLGLQKAILIITFFGSFLATSQALKEVFSLRLGTIFFLSSGITLILMAIILAWLKRI